MLFSVYPSPFLSDFVDSTFLNGSIILKTLFENPLPILAVGAVLATLCGLAFLSRRDLKSLLAFAAVLALTLVMVGVETWVVTPREEVELAMEALLRAVKSNQTSSILALIDPEATKIRSDAEKLIPRITVEDTGATAVKITLGPATPATSASLSCKGRLRGIHRSSGQPFMFFDRLEVEWVKREGLWLLEGYTAYLKGKPLNAVNSLQGNRPAPATR